MYSVDTGPSAAADSVCLLKSHHCACQCICILRYLHITPPCATALRLSILLCKQWESALIQNCSFNFIYKPVGFVGLSLHWEERALKSATGHGLSTVWIIISSVNESWIFCCGTFLPSAFRCLHHCCVTDWKLGTSTYLVHEDTHLEGVKLFFQIKTWWHWLAVSWGTQKFVSNICFLH